MASEDRKLLLELRKAKAEFDKSVKQEKKVEDPITPFEIRFKFIFKEMFDSVFKRKG